MGIFVIWSCNDRSLQEKLIDSRATSFEWLGVFDITDERKVYHFEYISRETILTIKQ